MTQRTRRWGVALAAAVALAGCGPAREARSLHAKEIPPTAKAVSENLEEQVGATLLPGNRVELVNNGRVFDVLVDEINRATSSVHILLFIWRPGENPSGRVLRALMDARERGVECRVLVEQIGSKDFEEKVWPVLEKRGCEVHFAEPMAKVKTADEVARRNHRKIVVVDGKIGITGGFGIWKSWLGDGKTHDEWRDTAVRVEGPAVKGMQQAFGQNWVDSGGQPLPATSYPEIAPAGDVRAGFVASTEGPPNNALKMTHLLVGAAKHRLWIANSYFVPPDELIHDLVKKEEQGVDVRVLGPGDEHDVPPVLAGQRATYPPLVQGGVQIWEYQPAMMHSKIMIVDDRFAVIGSTNLDPFSLEQIEEGSLVIDSPALVAEMAKDFEQDLALSKPIEHPESTVLQRLSRRMLWFLGRNL